MHACMKYVCTYECLYIYIIIIIIIMMMMMMIIIIIIIFIINNLFQVQLPLDGSASDRAEKGDAFSTPRRRGMRGIVIAMYMDVASRICFPAAFFLFILCYWIYYTML